MKIKYSCFILKREPPSCEAPREPTIYWVSESQASLNNGDIWIINFRSPVFKWWSECQTEFNRVFKWHSNTGPFGDQTTLDHLKQTSSVVRSRHCISDSFVVGNKLKILNFKLVILRYMSKCCLYDNFMMPFCCLLLSLRFFPIVLIFFTLLNDIAKNKNKNYGYKQLLIFDLWFPHFSNIPKNCKN